MSEILTYKNKGHFIDDILKHSSQYNLINLVNNLIKETCVEEFIEEWIKDTTGSTDCVIRQSERYEELLLLQSKINQFKKEYQFFFKKEGK